MNTELLKEIQKKVAQYPENTNMSMFLVGRCLNALKPECNTTGCIAGWAIAIHHKVFTKELYDTEYWDIKKHTAELLDLDEDKAHKLFFVGHWPTDFFKSYPTFIEHWNDVCIEANHKLNFSRLSNYDFDLQSAKQDWFYALSKEDQSEVVVDRIQFLLDNDY